MSVDSHFNFLCGRLHGLDPLPPVHMRPPEPDPLHVDVINGWPLIILYQLHGTFCTLHCILYYIFLVKY